MSRKVLKARCLCKASCSEMPLSGETLASGASIEVEQHEPAAVTPSAAAAALPLALLAPPPLAPAPVAVTLAAPLVAAAAHEPEPQPQGAAAVEATDAGGTEPCQCRICFASEGDEGAAADGEFVSPCLCSGSQRWVHARSAPPGASLARAPRD